MDNKCYIISYEISSSTNEVALENAIKSYGSWAKITDNTWAIVASASAVEVRDFLWKYLNQGDRVFVVKSGLESAWHNVICSNEWLKRNL